MRTLWSDVRYAVRVLRTRPGFTSAAVLSLALGIGACTVIFSIVDAVLLRSLPYPEPDRIVQIREVSEKNSQMAVAEPNFVDLRAEGGNLEAVAQYQGWLATVTGGIYPVRARTFRVSADFFRILGVRPLAGRTFAPEESRPGGAAVALVSYGFWQRLLGGRADFAGTSLKIDDQSLTVVGVMPPGFGFPQDAEVWVPRELFLPQTSRTAHNWSLIARVRTGVTLEQARAEASAVAKRLKAVHGDDTDAVDFALVPLHEYLVGNVRNVLLIVFGAVAFLLFVACTNVANLLLAQATARQKESAVRAALGATRWRLARQFITENTLLALIGGAAGVLLSFWGVDLLVGLNQNSLPRAGEIGVDARVLLFTLGLSLLVAVILGLVPVVHFSGENLQAGLKEAGRGYSADAANNRLRGLLVVAQIALTLMLLIGAGLLGKSFYRLLQIDPGFRPESVVAMNLSLPSYEVDEGRMRQFMQAYERLLKGEKALDASPPQSLQHDWREKELRTFHRQLLEQLGRLPGVGVVGSISSLPLAGNGGDGTFLVDNNPAQTGYADYGTASSGYFAAMGIPLLRGRLFDTSDEPESPHVAVISQSLAQKTWPNEDPIGRRIQFGNMDGDLRLLHIVGVVGDVRSQGLEKGASPMVYANALQRPQSSALSIVVRAQTNSATLIPAMRQAVRALDPELPTDFRTLEQIMSSSLDRPRFSLVVFAVFAVVALILAVTGIYGVMAYAIGRRTQEIGIRLALGATVKDILKLIMGQGLKLILPGVVFGIAGALVLTRLLASLLFGLSATDPATFAAVAALLAVVALVACYLPARRATKVDPLVALRYE